MIYTMSKFNYGLVISINNNSLNFDEGGGELTAVVPSGSYTIDEFADAITAALNAVGALDYAVSVNRTTHKFTISASGNFDILLATGSNIGNSFAALAGFVSASDLTGAATYTSNQRIGSEYYPQFMLQSYVPPENYISSADAVINQTASGNVEVVRFGVEQKIEMDIRFITSLPMDGIVIKNNPNGLAAAVDFLAFITNKYRFEFVPDVDSPENIYKVILESIPNYNNGTGFKLRELFAQGLPDVYETGVLTLRVVQ